MRIALVGEPIRTADWQATAPAAETVYVHLNTPEDIHADAYIDLDYTRTNRKPSDWSFCTDKIILIDDVLYQHEILPHNMIRINGWPGFFGGPLLEAASKNNSYQEAAAAVIRACGRTAEWVSDVPGMVSPRVVCMIINEAALLLEEGISTREETDIAMRLGTNYPYGPFDWGDRIGWKNIFALLNKLKTIQHRYQPCRFIEEAAAAI